MKSKKLYITMSIFIVVMVGGGTMVSVYFEDIKIRCCIWKLDSKDEGIRNEAFEWLEKKASERKPDDLTWDTLITFQIRNLDRKTEADKEKAFEWLKKLAKENLEDIRLKAFFKHPESRIQLEGKWKILSLSAKDSINDLFSAAAKGDLIELKILLEHGVDVNAKINKGFWKNWTPLHYAARDGSGKVAQILIKHGADVNAISYHGVTPLDLANEKGQDKIITILRKAGAKSWKELRAEGLKKIQEKKDK